MSSSPSSPRSSSPSPPLISTLTSPTTSNKKKKSTSKQTEHGREEGEDPNWAFKPPPGAKLLNSSSKTSSDDFDWDAVKDDDETEIWLIRTPQSLSVKRLDQLLVLPENLPTAKNASTVQIGTLKRDSKRQYDVWSIGDDEHPHNCPEMKSLSCLLPRKSKKGLLYEAPKKITRRLTIIPKSEAPDAINQPTIFQNPARPSYPKELFKHRFLPYGSSVTERDSVEDADANMDVDVDNAASSTQRKTMEGDASPRKKKKRKEHEGVEDAVVTPKKSKKGKTTS